jgi:hypothetical protein
MGNMVFIKSPATAHVHGIWFVRYLFTLLLNSVIIYLESSKKGKNMPTDVFQFVQKHLPDAHLRPGLLQMLAESMTYAQRTAPEKWTLTCNRDALRLNVGMIEVLVFTRAEVNIVVDEGVFNQIDAVTDWQITMTGEFADEGEVGVYASVPGSAALFAEPSDAVIAMTIVRPAHHLLMQHAAVTRVNPAVIRAHQADLAAWVTAGNWTL